MPVAALSLEPLLDGPDGIRPGLRALGIRFGGGDGGSDLVSDIPNLDELVGPHARHVALLPQRFGIEAIVQDVFTLARDVGRMAAPTVMVRQDQSIRRDERGRAAGGAKRRPARPLEPYFARLQAGGLRDVLDGRLLA